MITVIFVKDDFIHKLNFKLLNYKKMASITNKVHVELINSLKNCYNQKSKLPAKFNIFMSEKLLFYP